MRRGFRLRRPRPLVRAGFWLLWALAWSDFSRAQDGGTAPAEPVAAGGVAAEVDLPQVKLGQAFVLTLRVPRAAGDVAWTLPPSVALDPFVELSRESAVESQAGHQVDVLRLRLATFERVGKLEVPSFRLQASVDGGVAPERVTPPVPVEVLSLLAGTEDTTPRDVRPPVLVRVRDWRPLALVGLALSWLAVALLLRRNRRSAPGSGRFQNLPAERAAHEIALERLRAVVADDLLRRGEVQEYFVRISDAIREYLGNRYGFFALDLTTRELVVALRDRLTPGLDLALLERRLGEADLVKFARVKPSDAMCSEALDGAFALIEATRVREQPQPQTEGAA